MGQKFGGGEEGVLRGTTIWRWMVVKQFDPSTTDKLHTYEFMWIGPKFSSMAGLEFLKVLFYIGLSSQNFSPTQLSTLAIHVRALLEDPKPT